jgi:hypothetical protein
MLTLWGPSTRYGLWRRLWLALAESQQALGIDIPDAAIADMRAHLDDIDFFGWILDSGFTPQISRTHFAGHRAHLLTTRECSWLTAH